MPVDRHDDDEDDMSSRGGATQLSDFDCPGCNANNPVDPPFGDGDEVMCHYCGNEYRVKIPDDGRPRFREQ